jgi:hypothetical protein
MRTRGRIGLALLTLAMLAMPWRLEAGQRTLTGNVQVGDAIDGITPTVEGATNTYVFTPDSLNMAGYRIYTNSGQRHLILTNLTELTDSGGTAGIDLYSTSTDAGFTVVVASNISLGKVAASGRSIDTRSTSSTKNGGAVTLLATNVALTGDVITEGGVNGGAITIHDGAGGPARVAIGGNLSTENTASAAGVRAGGAITVTGSSVNLSNVNTRARTNWDAGSGGGGAVNITANGTITVNGYITTAIVTTSGRNAGAVTLTADGSITVSGTTNSISIETRCAQTTSTRGGAANITVLSTNGDITITGGLDASHGSGALTKRGTISLSATNGSITIGSLNTNLFKTISLRAGTGTYHSIYVTGVLTNFGVSESPSKRFTFPTNCVVGNDIYYSLANNGAGLSGTYDIYVATQDTGKDLKEGPPPAPGGSPATIENLPATNVTTTGATFKGFLEVAGDPAAAVYVLWGETNGAAGGGWAYTNSWTAGAWGSASYPSTNIAPLTQNRNYYYTFGAQNLASNVVATPLQYFITGALGLQVTDGSCGTNLADTGTLVISRPDTCTNEALPVYYSLGGAEQYVTASPASGFEIAKGETQRTITLQPRVPNWGAASNFTVALLPGPYPSASLASVEVTVQQATYYDLTLAVDLAISNTMDVVENPPDTVAVSGSNPYVYDLWTASLDMAGRKIYYNTAQRHLVLTNLTALTDSGGTAVIDTSAANQYADAGFAKVYASSRVALGGYIKTASPLTDFGDNAGAVVVSAPSITISGTNASGLSIDSRSGAAAGGSVTLLATNVVLAGGIDANGYAGEGKYAGWGGSLTIHDGAGGPAWVAIGGSVIAYGSGGGAVTVVGKDISVSNINTRSQYELRAAGAVTLTATGTVAVGGYITAANIGSGNGGAVSITAGASVTVGGTTNGIGIETRTTQTGNANPAGNITIASTNGDITVTGGFDASHPYGVSRRGAISLSATNGRITVGSLDANRFKTISLQAASGRAVYVTGAITSFIVSESPKTITFPPGSAIGNDIYYNSDNNGAGLSGAYMIYVDSTNTGRLLKEEDRGTVFKFR